MEEKEFFITTWETKTDNESITIPAGSNFNYSVDWGDGNKEEGVSERVTHNYAKAGIYKVKIIGDFPAIFFIHLGNEESEKIRSIEQWGSIKWKSFHNAFHGCSRLILNASDAPDLSDVTNVSRMFCKATLINGDFNHWDVSSITDMSWMFSEAISFNSDISNWNTSKVINMEGMFSGAQSFNQSLLTNNSMWDVSNVINMNYMFSETETFNEDISNWNTSSVKTMRYMFSSTKVFNSDISNWNTSKVTDVMGMFHGAEAFNQDLITSGNSWNIENVLNLDSMFSEAALFNGDISNWNTSNVIGMRSMFKGAKSFNQDLSAWNTVKVNHMISMFEDTEIFNGDISNWNTTNLTSMHAMFKNAKSFNQDLIANGDTWNISRVSSMNHTFEGAESFNGDITTLNTSNVRGMHSIFKNAKVFDRDLNDWNTGNVTTMRDMFFGAMSFNGNITTWNTSKVTDMYGMFQGAKSFNQDLITNGGVWNVSNVRNMTTMFAGAESFNGDVSTWNTANVVNMYGMFQVAKVFNQDLVTNGDVWNVSNVEYMNQMFSNATLFNGDISNWDTGSVKNMRHMFASAESFNSDLSQWQDNLYNVESTEYMFFKATSFNQDLKDWNLESVINMKGMFYGASNFNGSVSGWNISKNINFENIFRDTSSFNQDISSWDISSVSIMKNMFIGNTVFSVENYDALLIAWSKLNLQENVFFPANYKFYCLGEKAREDIISKFKWTISYDRKDPECGKVDINKSAITANPKEIDVNSSASSIITIQLFDNNGIKITTGGETVTIKTTLGNLSNVTDNLNGTYTASLSSEIGGNAEVSFSIEGNESINKANVSFVEDTESFITTWQTTTDNESITIPTEGSGYNYTVDWGDGTIDIELKGKAVHTYEKAGIHTVKIKGDFPRIFFVFSEDKDKILSIEQWGAIKWQSMEGSFHECSNLVSNAIDAPDLSSVTDMSRMFYRATSFNSDLNNWDVSNVTNMSLMFAYASIFNGDISNWDVKSSKYMSGMFWHASMFNQDISNWNVSGVIDMSLMFYFAVKFNKDLSKWNEKVSQVELMGSMFRNAILFDGNIGGWNVKNVTHMSSMFNGAKAFNSDISNWNVSKVESMNFMFSGAISFNRDLSKWNVSKVTNMSSMFQGAKKFNANLNDWNVCEVTDMASMFASASEFSSDLYKWKDKLGKVERMSQMFSSTKVFNSDISAWDVSNVIDMNFMFFTAKSFNQDISKWNVGNVTNMNRMFMLASSFDQDIGEWDVSNVTDMTYMFKSAKLSTENYDASLIGWSKQNLKENVPFDGGNSNYCDGEKAREDIISKFNWTITDSGRDIACVQLDLTKSTITALPQNVNINKGKSSVITVQLKDELGNSFTRPTELVSIVSTKGVINTIQNLGNGLYQTQLRDDSVGTAIVSYKVGEENGIQNALVSFYQPLECQIAFNIKADQDIKGAKGRYRLVSNSEARSETSWNVFDILNFNNSLTPLIREEGEYQLEVIIKGENGIWTDWYSHSSFIINDCQAVEGASVEVYKGDCKAVIRGKIKLFFENNDAGIKLYKDASLRIPFDGNDESYVVLDEVSESDASREVAVVKTVVFNVSNEGIVSNLRPCSLGDVSDNVEDES